MMMKRPFSLHLLTFSMIIMGFLAACRPYQSTVIHPLDQHWMLHLPNGQSIPVEVPGLVHTQLFQAGLIPDPFYGFNEDSLQWIGERPWLYTLDFEVDRSVITKQHVQLVFEGLDTYAQVMLNGKEIIRADNMFRQWTTEVKNHLREGSNRLELLFFPPDSISKMKAGSYGIVLPDVRAFTRKAPFQAGWDWGPVYHTMGIWKPVKLLAWDHAKLDNAAVLTQYADSLKADLELVAAVQSALAGKAGVRLTLDQRTLLNVQVDLKEGMNHLRLPFQIQKPNLWWPNGTGPQNLSRFELQITDAGGGKHQKTIITGIRNIALVREPDSIGESFVFNINHRNVFAKGANYIPEDHFVTRMSRQKTRQLLLDAAAVNMNMIRVWGGGIYPSEEFYEICDSLGLMVWQDFMFACTVYPWDSGFLENVRAEAMHQVQRMRGHPSLVMWCGNNEVSEGFHNWGWQKSLNWSPADSVAVWQGYLALFEDILPKVVSAHDPYTPYWPSSPSLGWGLTESLKRGDVHYWGVWWGEEPFEVYRLKVGRFNSEYGFQAMPAMHSITEFLPENELFIGSAGFEAHQKHPRGTRLINDYMSRDFPVPSQLDDYIYMSQLTQAYGLGMAIEAHRINQPITMGTLYWQLNDSWPVTSWSSIDYYGKWKALHYRLRQLYSPLGLFFKSDGATVDLYVVNNGPADLHGNLEISVINTSGTLIERHPKEVWVKSGNSSKVLGLSGSKLIEKHQPSDLVIRAVLRHEGDIPAENTHLLVRPKELNLVDLPIRIEKRFEGHTMQLKLKSDVFHYAVQLTCNDGHGRFSDNFFHLTPGEEKTVSFVTSGRIPVEALNFGSRSLNQFKKSRKSP